MRSRKQVTKPRQAGSARSLDRWQKELAISIAHLGTAEHGCVGCVVTRDRLTRLLASMQRSERR